jgi:hemerythrin
MSLLTWKPAYTIGIPAIDFEHRQMIAMINDLYQEIETESNREAIEDGLGEIHAGIAAHFALEEHQMRKAAYEEYSDHKDNHEELLDQLREMMDRYADDPVLGRKRLEQQLTDWFSVHFSSFDARLHQKLG